MENKQIYNDVMRSYYDDNYLSHHGIKGQKWGVRRFQKQDETRTSAGKAKVKQQNTSRSSKVKNRNTLKAMRNERNLGADALIKKYGKKAYADLKQSDKNREEARRLAIWIGSMAGITGLAATSIMLMDH